MIDDHSRVAYSEVHDDETARTATRVLRRAVAWFAARGITTQQVLSDNSAPYISHLWPDARGGLSIGRCRTRPYGPVDQRKIECFHCTLADGWGYARCYTSEAERRAALAARPRHDTTPPTPHHVRQRGHCHPVGRPAGPVHQVPHLSHTLARGLCAARSTPYGAPPRRAHMSSSLADRLLATLPRPESLNDHDVYVSGLAFAPMG